MSRIIDRVLARIVPKATASACHGADVCINHTLWWQYCCPQFGCQYTPLAAC